MITPETLPELKTLIVDDEPRSRSHLQHLIEQYCHRLKVIATASGGQEALAVIPEVKPDVIFLDVLMPNMNGFEMLNQCKDQDFLLVFVTAHEDFGIKAIHANATDYVLKPIDTVDLQRAVGHVLKVWEKRKGIAEEKHVTSTSQKITLPYSDGFHIVDADRIIRLESDNSYTTVYSGSGKSIVSSKSIHEFEHILNPRHFVRIHRSHIVNLNFVQEFNRKYDQVVILSNGDRVPVSRRKLKVFQEVLHAYMVRS